MEGKNVMRRTTRTAATVLAALALTLGSAALAHAEPGDDGPSSGFAADTYADAYYQCDTFGWDAYTVNQCRWAAYYWFGGQMIDAYHQTTEA